MSTLEHLIERVDNVEDNSYLQLYTAGAAWGTGWHEEDGVTVVWSGNDDDPAFSCVQNLGDASDPESTLTRLEQAAANRNARMLGICSPPDLEQRLGEDWCRVRGYERDSEECVWALDLTAGHEPSASPDDVSIRLATTSDLDAFVRTLNIGWSLPEDAARGFVFASTIGLPAWTHYIAYVEEQVAGIAVLFIEDQVADCFLAATLPEFRGKGVQTALIERRLLDGMEAGCDLATSQTVVYNASPRNMARRGFQPLYRRWMYGKRLTDAP